MRRLKKTLGDGKEYTFVTLQRSEVIAARKLMRGREVLEQEKRQKELEKIIEEAENVDNIPAGVFEELDAIENRDFDRSLNVVRMSLKKTHPEFGFKDDQAEEEKIRDRLDQLFDVRDLMLVIEFVLSGTIKKEETFVEKDIVL